MTGDWLTNLDAALDNDRHTYRRDEDPTLPDHRPDA